MKKMRKAIHKGPLSVRKKYYTKTAEDGLKEAQYNYKLGAFYDKEGNIAQAKKCYTKAASQGFNDALNNLKVIFEGEGKSDVFECAKSLHSQQAVVFSKALEDCMKLLGESSDTVL